MTEQTELSEEQKADLAARENEARTWTRVQAEEGEKAQTERNWKDLSKMSTGAAREFVRKTCGFDPGF